METLQIFIVTADTLGSFDGGPLLWAVIPALFLTIPHLRATHLMLYIVNTHLPLLTVLRVNYYFGHGWGVNWLYVSMGRFGIISASTFFSFHMVNAWQRVIIPRHGLNHTMRADVGRWPGSSSLLCVKSGLASGTPKRSFTNEFD